MIILIQSVSNGGHRQNESYELIYGRVRNSHKI